MARQSAGRLPATRRANSAASSGKAARYGLEAPVPVGLQRGAARAGVPAFVDGRGNRERRVRPAERGARQRDFLLAQRRAVRLGGAGLARSTAPDHGPAADQRGPVATGRGRGNRRVDGGDVVPVDVRDHVPAVGGEALRRVVGEPAAHLAVDRDAVVVVEHGELAEAQRSGERRDLVRNALHQAAVADERVGSVVDDRVSRPIEVRGEELLGERHPDRVGEALPERPGRRLHTGRDADLRMPRGARVQLPEALQLVEREVVAGQVQQRVEQHRTVAVGQDEAVAVRPLRVCGVVAQVALPQRDGDLRHAHRHARMSAPGGLDGVHGEGADGVGEFRRGDG